eukprot:157003-Chlamydomonas_euryale.AAC.1
MQVGWAKGGSKGGGNRRGQIHTKCKLGGPRAVRRAGGRGEDESTQNANWVGQGRFEGRGEEERTNPARAQPEEPDAERCGEDDMQGSGRHGKIYGRGHSGMIMTRKQSWRMTSKDQDDTETYGGGGDSWRRGQIRDEGVAWQVLATAW